MNSQTTPEQLKEQILVSKLDEFYKDMSSELRYIRTLQLPVNAIYAAMEQYASQFRQSSPVRQGREVFAVTTDWGIKSHPTDLSNVMKPEECLFIGTAYECACFIRDNRPVQDKGYSREAARKEVTRILYQNSTDDSECMRIDFQSVQKVIDEIMQCLSTLPSTGEQTDNNLKDKI